MPPAVNHPDLIASIINTCREQGFLEEGERIEFLTLNMTKEDREVFCFGIVRTLQHPKYRAMLGTKMPPEYRGKDEAPYPLRARKITDGINRGRDMHGVRYA